MLFNLKSDFSPAGDQPEAIRRLVAGLTEGEKFQTLLGVTGSGKTFTLANAIARFDRPVLVLSHNKTLAAQLFSEFKAFFPDNAVEYFVSYYDYYLPEAYIPQTDTYIAKDASINENIERFRLSATASLMSRRDVIVVASVSCIYGLGSPNDYRDMCAIIELGSKIKRNDLLRKLIEIQYERNDTAPEAGEFRVRGDCVDVFPPERENFLRIGFWGDEIEEITRRDKITGEIDGQTDKAVFFPRKHFVMPKERIEAAIGGINREMRERVSWFESQGMLLEAQRIYQRTNYDIEMLREIGYCQGIENYARHLSGRGENERPYCLLDFFPNDFIAIIDESHATIPQVGGMFKADRSRKQTLVDHGFRLPSALDNRPLQFDEFESMLDAIIFVSATPGAYELEHGGDPIRQIVRPTGLLDPEISVRSLEGQIDDVMAEIRSRALINQRVIVTTLTKKSAERLADYLNDLDLRVKYLHSEIDAIERARILMELRRGDFDCLIGINLLREGIDLPEVSLVAILDADKEGFLRSERSLIQVAGRAARNADGKVILYADKITDSIKKLLTTTNQRRRLQERYNQQHGITPKTIVKEVRDAVTEMVYGSSQTTPEADEIDSPADNETIILELESEMLAAAENLEFERAAELRDQIKKLTNQT